MMAVSLKFTTTLALVVFLGNLHVAVSCGPVSPTCLLCICKTESNCKMPNPLCRMDGGSLSCGPYQIKEAYWMDATEQGASLMGDWKKCTASFTCSVAAIQEYMKRYATIDRLGYEPTCEDFARIHNGGPDGYTESSTLAYWDKVKACLQN